MKKNLYSIHFFKKSSLNSLQIFMDFIKNKKLFLKFIFLIILENQNSGNPIYNHIIILGL
jgi:hypothetical protein